MRRPLHEGQTPRPLQEKPIKNPWPQAVQRARAKPQQRMPQRRKGPELLFDVRRDGLVALLACGEPGLEVRGDDPVERRLVWPSGPVALGALGRQSGP
jgi:hypothetical protein